MYYYFFDTTTQRCFGFSDGAPAPMDGVTVFASEKKIDNYSDYLLQDGTMVYSPKEEEA